MGHVRQISEIKTEAFTSNKREKFGFYGVFRGKKHGLPTAKILVLSLCTIPQRV